LNLEQINRFFLDEKRFRDADADALYHYCVFLEKQIIILQKRIKIIERYLK